MIKAELMGVSPSQVSCRSKNYSCPKQSTSEETPECGAECKCTRISEQKNQLRSETLQTKPGDVECECAASETLQPSSEEVIKDANAESLDSPDASNNSLMNRSSSLELNAKDQKLEFLLEDTHGECGVVSLHGTPKGKKSLGSGIVQNDIALTTFNKTLQALSEDVAKNSFTKNLDLPRKDAMKSSQFDKCSCPQLSTSEHTLDFPSDVAFEPLEERPKPSQELVQGDSVKIITEISSCTATGNLEEPPALAAKSSPVKGLPPDHEINIPAAGKLGSAPLDMDKDWNREQSETPFKYAVSNSCRSGSRVKRTPKSSKRKNTLRSLIRSDRVLRARSQEKPEAPESSANVANVNYNIEKARKKTKKRRPKRVEADEYSRIRKHLRYLLNRMSYEQSLITAYSAEGWKGLSLEKLKPEKELQRATSEIFRRKSKIRDLFQHIDSLCAEGRLSQSLFDSEGQISSEDIFCAKCGSKDLTADNDIILCDGACDRGFHQFCLVPPLSKEDIPPDDEGWLCPGCDCKVDCIDLLNESQGTNISINDSWEKVFPEVAAAGQNPDQNLGLPSDDSDDNDYDPDNPEIDEESQGDESSSDDSDFTSDELEVAPGDKQQLRFSSDDSEDDDYDPDAPDLDDYVKEESSSSDFTSDCDDLATFHSDKFSGEVESCKSIFHGDAFRKGSYSGGKKQSLHSELLSILEPNAGQDMSSPISARRNVERLDYKKLCDETYGNVSSDSSDDEDYNDAVGPRKRRKGAKSASTPENGNTPVIKTARQEQKDTECTPKRSHQRSNSENAGISPTKAHEGSLPSSSSSKNVRPSVYKRLGEAVTQRLYKAFKENQYPDRATKESLAKELKITFQQVTKWFENTRWSFNHSSSMDASTIKKNSERDSPVPKANTIPLEPGHETVGRDATRSGAQSEESPKVGVTMAESHTGDGRKTESGGQGSRALKSKTPRPRKRAYFGSSSIANYRNRKAPI